jgi:hypothetical protein
MSRTGGEDGTGGEDRTGGEGTRTMFRKFAAVGGCLALVLLIAAAMPAAALGANPDPSGGATRQITVSAWQAALIAIGYYLANSPWLFGLAFFTLYRPLVAGLFVGLILGDPAGGTLIGAAINVPYLGFISVWPAASTRRRPFPSPSAWDSSARSSSTDEWPSTRSSPTGRMLGPRRPTSPAWP